MKTFDFDREETIETALAEAVKACPPPPGLQEAIRERLFGNGQDLASQPSPYPVAAKPGRLTPRRMASYAAGLAIVASLLVMLAIWVRHGDLGASVAFADVQEAIRHIETATAVFDWPLTPWMNHRVLYRSDCEVVRQEWPNGEICLRDTKRGQELILDPEKKTVRTQDCGRGGAALIPVQNESDVATPREFLAKLAQIEQTAAARLGEREIDGRKLVGFVLPRNNIIEDHHMLCHVWVDPQTRLPVRYEVLPEDPSDMAASFLHFTLTFTFNQPLDASLFRLVPPEGYTVLHEAAYYSPYLDRLPLPPKDEKLASPIIVPGVGIGKARFGMSLEKVVEVLGRPENASYYWDLTPEETRQIDEAYRRASQEAEEKGLKGIKQAQFANAAANRVKIAKRAPSGMSLDYISRGFKLVVSKDQGLVRLFCYGKGHGMRPFTGKTFKGVGMGVTTKELEKIYGPPSAKSERLLDGVRRGGLYYKSLGMLMQLRDGRLCEMSFDRPPAAKPATEKRS